MSSRAQHDRGSGCRPGQLAQTLPRPKDFADAMTLVPREAVAESVACGPDPDAHAAQMRAYFDADVDEVYVQQIGHVLPQLQQ
jgi:hypothetical protein